MMKVKESSDNPGTEMDTPLDMKQLCFNNLQLLGFDAPAMEAANHIPFNKTMFELPNKRGAEIVLHYLFQRLNPTMCREAFRDCWPILDKKREQGFRKTCSNWLTNMAQEPDSHLPRINASLFMSPGGEKFYQLLFHFSGYVLQKVLDTDLASKSSERLKYPTLTQQNVQLGEVIIKELTCSSIRHRKSYFDAAQLTLKANKSWKDSVDEYVRDYRRLSKEVRDLDYKVREEEQRNVEASLARGSPAKKRGHSEQFDPDFDPRTIKRAQRIQQVRDMWKQLEDFDRTDLAEREVIESIVERTINKYRLDAADISVKVPDMLLRECGEEIRRRNVDNTYQGGKLNLVSVLQLWNLCLHLYLEKLHQVGVPKFDEEVKKMTSQLHVQQSYQQNAQTLRHQMSERIPVMKASIEKLREKLDGVLFKDQSPNSIRTTSVGLGLVGPSPQPSFSPGTAVTPAGGIGVPRSPDYVETPEAASRITQDVMSTVRQGPKQLFHDHIGEDLLAQDKRKDDSSIPLPRVAKTGSQANSRTSSRPTSARSTASTKGSKSSVKSTPRSNIGRQKQFEHRDDESLFTKVTSPRTMVESLRLQTSLVDKQNVNDSAFFHGSERLNLSTSSRPLSARSEKSDRSLTSKTLSARSEKSTTSPRSVKSGLSGNLSARSEKSADSPRSIKSGSSRTLSARSQTERGDNSVLHEDDLHSATLPERKTPADYLVEEIMGEGKILSPFNSGLEAFISREVVNRTPELEEEGVADKENVTPINTIEIETPVGGGALQTESPYDLQTDTGDEDGGEFEEILGPELEEEYDNDTFMSEGSQRSEEDVIVIDKSLHQSPRLSTDRRSPTELYTPESPEMLIDEEQFPSLENSPKQAIVIDRSYQQSPYRNESPRQPRTVKQSNIAGQQSMSPGSLLSISYQGKPASADGTPSAMSFLSQSLIQDRSPLSDEIRRMFKEAIADIPHRGFGQTITVTPLHDSPLNVHRSEIAVTPPQDSPLNSHQSEELELPNMDPDSREYEGEILERSGTLKQGDISWDMTENLDDIQMPEMDLMKGYDNDFDDDTENVDNKDKTADEERLQDILMPEFGDDDDDEDAIDEFFKSKTPELPKRSYKTTGGDELKTPPTGDGRGHMERSLGEGSSVEMPKFPLSSREDESPLISFTP